MQLSEAVAETNLNKWQTTKLVARQATHPHGQNQSFIGLKE
jgi:hypothetical protein